IFSNISEGLEDENRNVLAALLFGCRQGIDALSKHRLVLGGTIHVIAISGIHTAIFASIFLFLMFFIPFRARYFLLPFFVFFYVYCTGFQPSALRAFLMITIWSFGRSFLYPVSSYLSLLYAAVISLCLNPFSLLDTGFQYSFTITAFLIGAWNKASSFISLYNLENHFKVGVIRVNYLKKILNGFLLSSIMCVIALLAGLQISLFNQNIFNPFSVIVNLAITPYLYLIFVFSFLKILFPLKVLTIVFNFTLDFFRNFIVFFSDSAIRIATPPLFLVILFFSLPLVLIIFFSPSKRCCRILYILLFLSLIIFFALPAIRGNRTFLISGEGLPPAIVALRPKYDSVIVINAPSREHSRKIIELLSANGYGRIDKLYCTRALMKNIEGVPYLLSYFYCCDLIFLSNPFLSPYARFTLERAIKNNVKIEMPSDNSESNKKREINELKIELNIISNEIISMIFLRSGNVVIEIRDGKKLKQIEIPNSLQMKVQEIK
ncbi:MAG TPA: ComEC/Rec2 family competence protein, partial [Victivallales bacterium]|nr:ComEC/Rec2 family competence protein [Victivallales bacterium]